MISKKPQKNSRRKSNKRQVFDQTSLHQICADHGATKFHFFFAEHTLLSMAKTIATLSSALTFKGKRDSVYEPAFTMLKSGHSKAYVKNFLMSQGLDSGIIDHPDETPKIIPLHSPIKKLPFLSTIKNKKCFDDPENLRIRKKKIEEAEKLILQRKSKKKPRNFLEKALKDKFKNVPIYTS